MRTTLNIDENLLAAVVAATGEKTRSKAVNKALDEYIRGIKIDQLRAMAGRVQLGNVRSAQKAADRRRQRLLERLRVGRA